MASNNVTPPEEFEIGPVGGSPLRVNSVLALEDPEEDLISDDIDPPESFLRIYLLAVREDLTSADEQVMMSRRRSESAVEAVKDVKLEEASVCAICLQDLLVGIEAAKLPCSHFYHRPCIVKWFDRSNLCPLCRSLVV